MVFFFAFVVAALRRFGGGFAVVWGGGLRAVLARLGRFSASVCERACERHERHCHRIVITLQHVLTTMRNLERMGIRPKSSA